MKKEKINKIDKLFVDAQKRIVMSNPSIKKMKEYLKKKGGSKSEIEEVISKLKKYSLLDEDEIIKGVISYSDLKHYGYNKIISMLKQREIDESKISKLLKDESRENKESKELLKSLIKRYKGRSVVNLKRSIYSALIRYGYDENIANIRVNEVYISHSEEINVLILECNKLISSYSRKLDNKIEVKEKIISKLLTKGYKYQDIRKVIDKYEMD